MTNDVSPQIHLAFLTDAWNRAGAGANTLWQTLQDDQAAALQLVKQGSIASVGKNSTSQSYKGYGAGNLTHVQIVETIGNLIGLYSQLKSKITTAFTDDTGNWPAGVPADFDFDAPVYDLLTQVFTAQSSGASMVSSSYGSLLIILPLASAMSFTITCGCETWSS